MVTFAEYLPAYVDPQALLIVETVQNNAFRNLKDVGGAAMACSRLLNQHLKVRDPEDDRYKSEILSYVIVSLTVFSFSVRVKKC